MFASSQPSLQHTGSHLSRNKSRSVLSITKVNKPRIVLKMAQATTTTSSTTPSADTNKYFLLTLEYVENMLEKRTPYRERHINGAQKAFDDGYCTMAGALTDPVDTGVFVFKNVDYAFVENFVKNDAYFKGGLVPKYTIRPWMVVVGN
jgi:uncharacterized protein